MQHMIRWGHPGTTQWGTVLVETGTDWDATFAADGNWTDGGTVAIFSGSVFRGSYVDAYGSASSFYRIRYTDGTTFSDWSDPIFGHAPRAFAGFRDMVDRCGAILEWLPDTPAGTEFERMYRALGECTRAIESELDPVFPVPIQPGTDLQYDEPLTDACAYMALYRTAVRHYSGRELPEMYEKFAEMAQKRIDNLKQGRESLKYLVTPDEVGFTPAISAAGNQGNGLFEVDPNAYYNGQRRARFRVEITTDGAFHTAEYRYSEDGGVSWRETGQECGSAWDPVGGLGAVIRFRGNMDTGQYDFKTGDAWEWHGYPYTEAGGPGQMSSGRIILGG